jgi:choice-of-anchor B domain-containing protein
MKKLISITLLAVSGLSMAQYQSEGVRFLSQIAPNAFPGAPSTGSAIYGYTSPSGREYAIMGLRNGNAIIDITNPTQPVTIAHIPGPNSTWHENVVLGNHCYAVSDGNGAIGIQIIDLTAADQGQATLVATYNGSAVNKALSNVHTIQADPTTKRLFANGSNRGFVVFDATNPTNIVELGRWTTRYVHDSLIVNHTSGQWAGKQIAYLFCGTQGLSIVDITNPAAMVTLGTTPFYANGGNNTYAHSGVITPDLKYILANDEFDENKNITGSATTLILDVQNLAAPVKTGVFQSGINTIDHNSVLRDGYLYLSAYKAGVRIYDAGNPLAMSEIGWLDTFPTATDDLSYNGNWGVYAQFPSRNVILSDIDRGFFVVDPTEAIGLGAPITSMDFYNSQAQGGSSSSLIRENDALRMQLTGFQRGNWGFRTKFQTNWSTRSAVQVSLDARGVGMVTVSLRNWTTNQFVPVGNYVSNPTTGIQSFSGLPASYVNAAGEVEVQVTAADASRTVTVPWTMGLLQVKVSR